MCQMKIEKKMMMMMVPMEKTMIQKMTKTSILRLQQDLKRAALQVVLPMLLT